ncbi:MAG: hypothetical protein WCC65_01490 [Pseudonocardiaceae bacterium]
MYSPRLRRLPTGSLLRKKINETLLDITADGTYDELYSKYFEDPNSGRSRATRPDKRILTTPPSGITWQSQRFSSHSKFVGSWNVEPGGTPLPHKRINKWAEEGEPTGILLLWATRGQIRTAAAAWSAGSCEGQLRCPGDSSTRV